MTVQDNWKWCEKCQGLTYGETDGVGHSKKCPEGEFHSLERSVNYVLIVDTRAKGQDNWRWCEKCQGLTYGVGPQKKCPEGGLHSLGRSANYTLMSYVELAPIIT